MPDESSNPETSGTQVTAAKNLPPHHASPATTAGTVAVLVLAATAIAYRVRSAAIRG